VRIHSGGEQGQGLLSYALILVLVAIVVLIAFATYDRRISYLYEEVNCAFTAYPQRSGPMTI
jgi:Flp pilus assembly pilin Flp